mmetsp:Transcript_9421/g.34983  ORF Transcript_9421/g.34983 Transcript_9421/m.34983 type:complete len:672 (-) Transcript_9421:2117-4132(-)
MSNSKDSPNTFGAISLHSSSIFSMPRSRSANNVPFSCSSPKNDTQPTIEVSPPAVGALWEKLPFELPSTSRLITFNSNSRLWIQSVCSSRVFPIVDCLASKAKKHTPQPIASAALSTKQFMSHSVGIPLKKYLQRRFYSAQHTYRSLSPKHRYIFHVFALIFLFAVFLLLVNLILNGNSNQDYGSGAHILFTQDDEFDSSIMLKDEPIERLRQEKLLIVYAGYTADYSKTNTAFFMDFGVFPSDNVDFVIVSNGKWHLEVPKHLKKNVKFVYSPAEGRLDFFAWRDALKRVAFNEFNAPISSLPTNVQAKEVIHRLREKYKYFLLLNSSVRGPFLQTFIDPTLWPYFFLKHLSRRTKLVGMIFNYDAAQIGDFRYSDYRIKKMHNAFHIQSMVMAFDHVYLHLNWYTLFGEGEESKVDTYKKEILSSQNIIDAGYDTHVISWAQAGMDPKKDIHHFMQHSRRADGCKAPGFNTFLPNCYFGIQPDIFEFMFMKAHNQVWLDPQQLEYAVSTYTRYLYYSKLKCNSPDSLTSGASCKSKGAWLHRDENFDCRKIESSPDNILSVIMEEINNMGHKSVVDIGGAHGHHCHEVMQRSSSSCTVIEPAPMYGCMKEHVGFIQGNVLDENFDSDQKFDMAIMLHTLPYMHLDDEAVSSICNFFYQECASISDYLPN